MKRLLMFCLIAMAAAVMAAETPIEIKTKKDFSYWGDKKYYETVKVSVENGVAKIAVEKTVPGARPAKYVFGIRCNRAFKAGVNYKLTATLKSNQEAKVAYYVRMIDKPYKNIGDTTAEAELKADEPQTIELRFSVKEDVDVPTRLPSFQVVLKEGQTLELRDVKLAEEEAAK